MFRDITPLLANPDAFRAVIDWLSERAGERGPDVIVGIESRGFLFGTPLAERMELPFVPVRKIGKLPAAHVTVEYVLEYGSSQLQIHEDSMPRGARAFVVDDLLATGGTALASAKLVELIGGVVAGLGFVIELEGLGGRAVLADYSVESLLDYK